MNHLLLAVWLVAVDTMQMHCEIIRDPDVSVQIR